MNRRRLTLLSVTVAIILAAALAVGVWFSYFIDRGSGFALPSPLPSGLQPEGPSPSSVGIGMNPVTVDATNVQRLLTAVKRPEAYSQTITCVTYWEGGQEETSYHWARRGTLTRIQADGANGTQNRIVTPDEIYEWSGSTVPYYRLTPEETDAESLSGLPTWEDAASLPSEDILESESYYESSERFLRVRTREAVYTVEYILSLDTGLLVSAEYTDQDGKTAFRFYAGSPILGDPGDSRFTLPDGVLVE